MHRKNRHIRKAMLLLLALCYGIAAFSQAPGFRPLRYDEDYSYLAKDTATNAQLKFLPVYRNSHAYVSLGGEIRYQYFYTRDEDWGAATPDPNGYLLSRALLHADLHAGKRLRVFVQLQSSLAASKPSTSPVDENILDLHQAFVETNLNDHQTWRIRLGRQEMLYGSQRLVSVRDRPNNRQAFDAMKILYHQGNYDADLFYSYYVQGRKDLLDDAPGTQSAFWGFYLTRKKLPLQSNIDMYYLGLHKKSAAFDDGKGAETRHSLGIRIWKSHGTFQYDLESVYQAGTFAGKTISAWTASSNISYGMAALPLQPRIGLKTELISGDRRYGDDRLQTFNPLFPKGAYFGLAAVIGPSNLYDLHPSIELTLSPGLSMGLDYDAFWRLSLQDGIYTPNVTLIYSGRGTTQRSIGGQWGLNLDYEAGPQLFFRLEGTWFDAGPFLKAVSSGKDILFTGVTAQFKF